jgi:hypothetical protein
VVLLFQKRSKSVWPLRGGLMLGCFIYEWLFFSRKEAKAFGRFAAV